MRTSRSPPRRATWCSSPPPCLRSALRVWSAAPLPRTAGAKPPHRGHPLSSAEAMAVVGGASELRGNGGRWFRRQTGWPPYQREGLRRWPYQEPTFRRCPGEPARACSSATIPHRHLPCGLSVCAHARPARTAKRAMPRRRPRAPAPCARAVSAGTATTVGAGPPRTPTSTTAAPRPGCYAIFPINLVDFHHDR
jgi:hypothetical protein